MSPLDPSPAPPKPSAPPPPLGEEVSTLDEVLARRASTSSDALAFATAAESLTYGELQRDCEGIAGGLARLGLRPGDRVAVVLPPGLDFIRVFFALQRLGAVPCSFDPAAPAATTARRALRLRPALALVAHAPLDGLRCAAVGELPRAAGPAAVRRAEEVAFLQPTSGTSGEPRAAVVLQRNVLASLRISRDFTGTGPQDVLVGWAPPWHDLGLVRFLLAPVYAGAPCHLVPPAIRTLPLWLETATRVRATMLGAPDFAYRIATRLVDPGRVDLAGVRYAIDGGEPARLSTIRAFEERFGAPGAIRPGYGLAEAALGVACLRPGEPLRVDERGNVSCGRALPGIEVRVAPEEGEVGEILVRGPTVFAGYFDAPEATAEALRDGWLHTGDLGRLDGDGHLYVLGRRRALLKRGGAPLAPRELEEAAEQVPGVRAAAAVGLPPAGADAATEEILVAVELEPAAAPRAPEVAAAVAGGVEASAGFAPDGVVVLALRSIPRTSNGKVRHATLRRQLLDGDLERRGAVLFSSRPAPR